MVAMIKCEKAKKKPKKKSGNEFEEMVGNLMKILRIMTNTDVEKKTNKPKRVRRKVEVSEKLTKKCPSTMTKMFSQLWFVTLVFLQQSKLRNESKSHSKSQAAKLFQFVDQFHHSTILLHLWVVRRLHIQVHHREG
jgi:hypothetical protein